METNNLKSTDICNIIKTCAKSGVTNFEFGSIKIGFGEVAQEVTFVKEGDIIPLDITSEDKEFMSELQETQTMMDDPEQWEQNMVDSFMDNQNGEINAGSRRNEVESVL